MYGPLLISTVRVFRLNEVWKYPQCVFYIRDPPLPPQTTSFLPLLPSFLGLAERPYEPSTVYLSVTRSVTKVLILPVISYF